MASPVRGVSFLNAVMVTGGAEMVVVTLSGRGKRKKIEIRFGVRRAKVRRKWGRMAPAGDNWERWVPAWWGALEQFGRRDRDSGVGANWSSTIGFQGSNWGQLRQVTTPKFGRDRLHFASVKCLRLPFALTDLTFSTGFLGDCGRTTCHSRARPLATSSGAFTVKWHHRRCPLLARRTPTNSPKPPSPSTLAMAGLDSPPAQLAQALVDFSVHGSFPEDKVSSLPIDAESLPIAVKALADAKAKLQVCALANYALRAC